MPSQFRMLRSGKTHSIYYEERKPLIKRKFTADEDKIIVDLVAANGEKSWKLISSKLANRTSRQCRERWRNYLSPFSQNLPWTEEEDKTLLNLHSDLGSQWANIAKHFTKRTDVNVKNRWVLLQRKRHRATTKQIKPKRMSEEQYISAVSPPAVPQKQQDVLIQSPPVNKDGDKKIISMIEFWDDDQLSLIDRYLEMEWDSSINMQN